MFHQGVLEAYGHLSPIAQRILLVVVALILSTLFAWLVRRLIIAGMEKEVRIDNTLTSFMRTVLTVLAVIFVAFATLFAAGVPPTALAGLLAAAGFVVGFALKDTLGNLAAGVILLVNRPFHLDEVVTIKGHEGAVIELGMSMTRIKTFDGRFVSVPNGAILSEPILNWSRNPTRRVNVDVDVSYGDDLDGAIRTALGIAQGHPNARPDPPPDVIVTNLADSGVTLTVRLWVHTDVWYATWSDLRRRLKIGLEDAGHTIPFPQRDVHMMSEANPAQ